MYEESKEKIGFAVRKNEDLLDRNNMELEKLSNKNLAKSSILSKNTKTTKNALNLSDRDAENSKNKW